MSHKFAFAYVGTFLHKAEVRTKLLDGNAHHVPVVCMDVELDNNMHTHMHVERPYATNEHALAEADAARLKRGTRVTVEASMLDLRLLVRNAAQVTPIATLPAASAAPTHSQQEPELWHA